MRAHKFRKFVRETTMDNYDLIDIVLDRYAAGCGFRMALKVFWMPTAFANALSGTITVMRDENIQSGA